MGCMFKGAYTLSKSMNESDNDGRATLGYNTPSELASQLGAGGLRSPAQLPARLRLRAAVAEPGVGTQAGSGDNPGLAGQRRSGGIQRHAVHRHRERHRSEYAEQHADRGPGLRLQGPRRHRRDGPLVRDDLVHAADRRAVRQHQPEPVLRTRRVQPGSLGVPQLPDGRTAEARGSASRPATC